MFARSACVSGLANIPLLSQGCRSPRQAAASLLTIAIVSIKSRAVEYHRILHGFSRCCHCCAVGRFELSMIDECRVSWLLLLADCRWQVREDTKCSSGLVRCWSRVQGSKKMIVAVLALSLARAAWIASSVRDVLSVTSTLLFVLYLYAEKLMRLSSASSSEDCLKLKRRQRPFSSTLF